MSKLKEIIHQYVVEALQELLDEVEEVEEGYKREMRLVRALKKNPSNEKLKSQTNSAFNRGIERTLRSIRKRNSERVQKASQSDPHDQDF